VSTLVIIEEDGHAAKQGELKGRLVLWIWTARALQGEARKREANLFLDQIVGDEGTTQVVVE
jgi:hypothetical protein